MRLVVVVSVFDRTAAALSYSWHIQACSQAAAARRLPAALLANYRGILGSYLFEHPPEPHTNKPTTG